MPRMRGDSEIADIRGGNRRRPSLPDVVHPHPLVAFTPQFTPIACLHQRLPEGHLFAIHAVVGRGVAGRAEQQALLVEVTHAGAGG